MAISSNSTKAFTDAIKRLASKEVKQIESQTKLLKSQGLAEMKKDVRRKYDVYIDRELTKKRSDVNRQLSECSEQSKKELADLRAELTDKVFENVLKGIEEYTKTDAYFDALVGSIKELKAKLGGGKIKYYLREADLSLKDRLEKALGETLDTEADSEILVGGVRALDAATGTLADDTLDVKLADEKAWFLENSGLKI